jgi:hypothetical protein
MIPKQDLKHGHYYKGTYRDMAILEVKITRIRNRWHARLYRDKEVYDEMACQLRIDIGYICRQMLRWYDKSGGTSIYASKARERMYKPNNSQSPYGKIWWHLTSPIKRG